MEILISNKKHITCVTIIGELHIPSLDIFEEKWEEMVKNKPEIIALNCRKIEFIDSSALGSLAQFLKFLTNKQIKLVLVDLSIAVESLLKVTRLDKFFTITTEERLKYEFKNS